MISTKGRYAIRFMIDLAEQPADTPVPLDETAARQDISKKYLEIIVKILVKGRLVKGTSGKGGGYRLIRKPEEYTVGEILELTEHWQQSRAWAWTLNNARGNHSARPFPCGENLITCYTIIFSASHWRILWMGDNVRDARFHDGHNGYVILILEL